jgi:hypothetical protein
VAGRECYHCKSWIEAGQPHDCWTTTEAALTRDLPIDLREAWERLREAAASLGEQRIYASLNSIMFSRRSCYCFVRPRPRYLEVCLFLGRTLRAPQVQRATPASKVKTAHLIRIRHRDEVEPPITDWLREAYELQDRLADAPPARAGAAEAGARRPRSAAGKARKVSPGRKASVRAEGARAPRRARTSARGR